AVHRQAAGQFGAGEARAMPGLLGSVNDVALVGDEDGKRADLVLHFAEQDEPELGRFLVKTAFVGVGGGALLLGIADDDIGDGPIVGDEAPLLLGSRDDGVEIDVGLVALLVLAAAFDPNLHEIDAVQRHGRFIGGIHGLGARDVHFQA